MWCALLLLAASPGLAPQATACWVIEWNTFGETPRTAIIFWGYDGQVCDWRWDSETFQPEQVRPGHWIMTWTEHGKLLQVTAESVRHTRTREDRELAERERWPESKRRKLR